MTQVYKEMPRLDTLYEGISPEFHNRRVALLERINKALQFLTTKVAVVPTNPSYGYRVNVGARDVLQLLHDYLMKEEAGLHHGIVAAEDGSGNFSIIKTAAHNDVGQWFTPKGRLIVRPHSFFSTYFLNLCPELGALYSTFKNPYNSPGVDNIIQRAVEVLSFCLDNVTVNFSWGNTDTYPINTAYHGPIRSCMSGMEVTKWYDENGSRVGILTAHKTNRGFESLVGRALVWKLENGKILVDRMYVSSEIAQISMRQYASEQGWIDMSVEYEGEVVSIPSGELWYVPLKESSRGYPYMDTFCAIFFCTNDNHTYDLYAVTRDYNNQDKVEETLMGMYEDVSKYYMDSTEAYDPIRDDYMESSCDDDYYENDDD